MFYIFSMLNTHIKKHLLTLALTVVALLLPQSVFAAVNAAVPLIDSTQKVDVAAYISYYEDTSAKLGFDDIQGLRQELFTPNKNEVFHAGFTPSAYWLKVVVRDLRWNGPKLKRWLVELEFPAIDDIQFYSKNAAGEWTQSKVGNSQAFSEREFDFSDPIFSFSTERDTTAVFYFRLHSTGSLIAPIYLWDKNAFMDAQSSELVVWGAFFGLMAVMFFYNLFVYLSVRDISYLYYLGYLASVTLVMATLSGYALQFLWPSFGRWNEVSVSVISCLVFALGTLFARSFLHTQFFAPQLDRVLKGYAIAAFCFSIFCALTLGNHANIAAIFSFAFSMLLLVACFIGLRQGSRPARFFMIAWVSLLIGVVFYSLSLFGLIVPKPLVVNAIYLGTAIEVVLLSLALADRINEFKREKIKIQQQANQELELKNLDLRKALKTKDEFLGMVSHELRTPMNGVMGALELAEVAVRNGLDKPSLLRAAKFSADQMSNVLESMLTYIELQAGKVSAPKEAFDLVASVVDSIQQILEKNDATGLTIELKLGEPENYRIGAAKAVIERLIDLLLSNSIKFTKHGKITVHVDLKEEDPIANLVIRVEDTGIGIPPEEQVKVRQSFYQVNQSYSRSFGGLGMGLANGDLLLSLVGGRMEIRSPINPDSLDSPGTEVEITIPVELLNEIPSEHCNGGGILQLFPTTAEGNVTEPDRGSVTQAEIEVHPIKEYPRETVVEKINESKTEDVVNEKEKKDPSRKESSSRDQVVHAVHTKADTEDESRPRILIVEDNPTNMMVTKSIVKKMGAEIFTAENGQLAVDLLHEQTVDLILMDCQMPVMDGLEATEVIRASQLASAAVPILAVTANATLEDRNNCISVGMNDHISKPIKAKILMERIQHWLEQSALKETKSN